VDVYPEAALDIQEAAMTKRLVEIDDEVLEEARVALGTSTIKDTVNVALGEAAKAARRRPITREDLRRFAEAAADLGDPEIMAKAWD
jgi:Arc/MetJ family transcription regulator